jgi:large subunit ribosomal protein L54
MLPSTAAASKSDTKPKHIKKKQQKLVGSIPGGTPLQGLGYLKAKPIVLAKEDDEYPEWLWTLLDAGPGAKGKEGRMSAADFAGKKYSKRVPFCTNRATAVFHSLNADLIAFVFRF